MRVPILVFQAGLDCCIPPESAIEFERILSAAGHPDYTIRFVADANHGMFEAKTGFGSEGPDLERHVRGYYDELERWLARHVHASER